VSDLITARSLTKTFPGVRALHEVDFSLRPGEVHALVGENGSGKSTLIKILTGAYRRDAGEIEIKGQPVHDLTPERARALGLTAVYQDVTLARQLSVGENFFLGAMPVNRWGAVAWGEANRRTRAVLHDLGLDIDPRSRLQDLPVAKQEMVAIAKAVFENSDIIVFDEPTALLTDDETQLLFSIIRRLREAGKGIIYITHRLEEVFVVCDRVSVLKDGALVRTMNASEVDQDGLMRLMVGRSMADMYMIRRLPPGEPVLAARNLSREPRFRNVSFDVRKGEIFGLFGLLGSGRTDVLRTIYGADRATAGSVTVNGAEVRFFHPRDAIESRIGFLPEDRKNQSIALQLTVRVNANLMSYPAITRFGVLNVAAERRNAATCIDQLRVKTPSDLQVIRNLSGGNQQKVVLGRNLISQSQILLCDEPTIGVDVGAKSEIYKIFETLTAEGITIVLVSSYLPEVMGLADRILVLYEGDPMGIVDRADFNEEKLVRLASGIPS
jgi:ribose transport system ATP-binding protein